MSRQDLAFGPCEHKRVGAFSGGEVLVRTHLPIYASTQCFEHCQEVFGGGVALDVVDGVEDEAVFLAEDFHSLGDLRADFVGGAEGQCLLGIDAAAPEDDAAAEGFDEMLRVHSPRRRLDRIENVITGLDKAFDQRLAPPAAMLQRLPLRMRVNPIVELFGMRQVQISVRIGRAEQAVLGG